MCALTQRSPTPTLAVLRRLRPQEVISTTPPQPLPLSMAQRSPLEPGVDDGAMGPAQVPVHGLMTSRGSPLQHPSPQARHFPASPPAQHLEAALVSPRRRLRDDGHGLEVLGLPSVVVRGPSRTPRPGPGRGRGRTLRSAVLTQMAPLTQRMSSDTSTATTPHGTRPRPRRQPLRRLWRLRLSGLPEEALRLRVRCRLPHQLRPPQNLRARPPPWSQRMTFPLLAAWSEGGRPQPLLKAACRRAGEKRKVVPAVRPLSERSEAHS